MLNSRQSESLKIHQSNANRDVGANAFFRVISTPWERERKFHFYFGISFIFTALFGKYFSYFCLIEAFLTIRSMSNNTKAYQGESKYKSNLVSISLNLGLSTLSSYFRPGRCGFNNQMLLYKFCHLYIGFHSQ